MHLLSYNTHHYKKFKLKDKASKHVQVSKKCKFTWREKKMLQQQQQQHKHWGREFQVQHFMYFMEN